MQISQFVLYHGSDTNVKLPVWNSGSLFICELLEKELKGGK